MSTVMRSEDDDHVKTVIILLLLLLLSKFSNINSKIITVGNYPDDGEYVGTVPANSRLNIPALLYNDGPQGFRDDANPGTTTAFPSGLNIAATWDKEMAGLWGEKMGKEFFDKGANVMLGPGLNVARVPKNGRNFEYMSGEVR